MGTNPADSSVVAAGAAPPAPPAAACGCDGGACPTGACIAGAYANVGAAAPRLTMTRLSPSRTSTVLRSLAAMSFTICSSSRSFIGLPDADDGSASPSLGGGPAFRFFFSLNVTAFEAPVEVGQQLAAGVGDEHVVLDADAALAGEVNAGFDGDDHARPQLLLAAGLAHRRQLVDVAADAVAETVAEVLAESGALDDVAGDAVGLHGGDAGPEELHGRLLRLLHDLVNLLNLRTDPPDHQRAGHVGAVALVQRAPVEQQRLVALHKRL